MERRKRKSSMLFILSMLALVLLWGGAIETEAASVFYHWDESTRTITVNSTQEGGGYSYDEYRDYVKYIIIENGVTAITEEQFRNCESLISVEIPNTVTSIENRAFNGCESLASINIPGSVTSIGEYAFSFCESLTEVNFCEGLESIGEDAFFWCKSLRQITIPTTVTSMGKDVFMSCTSLESVTINAAMTEVPAGLFYGCSALASFNIAGWNSITSIGKEAFKGTAITEIEFPVSLTNIGESAFEQCTNLQEVIFFQNGERSSLAIGARAFSGCSQLTSITIPGTNGSTTIGSWALESCNSLSSITLEEGITSIGYGAFSSTAISEITIPASVTALDTTTLFKYCRSLTNVNILCNWTEVGRDMFSYCDMLEEITLPNTITMISENAFSDSGLERINLPNSVTKIGHYAFSYCRDLTEVNIPNTVTNIGGYAFYECNALETIHIPSSVTVMYSDIYDVLRGNMFEGCSGLKYVYMDAAPDKITHTPFKDIQQDLYMFVPESADVAAYEEARDDNSMWGALGFVYIWPDVPHQHDMVYDAEENSMKVYCEEDIRFYDCACNGIKSSKTITLNADDVIFDGTTTSEIEVTKDDDFPVADEDIEVLHYDNDGGQLGAAPTAVGTYKARITIGTATIEDEYEIYQPGAIGDTQYKLQDGKTATVYQVYQKEGTYKQIVKVQIYTYQIDDTDYYFLIDKDTNMPYSQPPTTDLDALKSSLDTFIGSASESEIEQFENKIYGVDVVPHTHTPTHVPALAPTCTATGNQEYYFCSDPNCGELFEDQECTIPTTADAVKESNLGHDLSEATCTAAPKCKREGCDYTEGTSKGHDLSEATCTDAPKCKRAGCDYTEGTSKGHDLSEATCTAAPKCKRADCDYTEGTSKGHDLSEATCTDAPKCKREGCDYTEGTSKGHDLSEATCTDAPKCKRAGCDYTEGTSKGHDLSEATCTDAPKCKREGCTHTEGKALGHEMTEATCMEPSKCQTPGCNYTVGEVSDEHDMLDATCEEPSKCQTPGCNYTLGEALGHCLSAATCTEPYKCQTPGCSYTLGEALGHIMSDATCEEASVCQRTGCNHIGEEALGHIYDEVTFVWSADYSKAIASCVCEDACGSVLSEECTVVSKVVKEATTTEDGKKVYTATVILDGETYTEKKSVVIPMLEDDEFADDEDDEFADDDEDGFADDDEDGEYIEYKDVNLEVDDVPDTKSAIVLNEKVKVTQTGSQINIKWGKVKDASGYDIYVQYCGKKFKSTPTQIAKSNKRTSCVVKKVNGKKLNLTKNYKIRVVAYKYVDGKKVVLAKSLTAHIVGRKSKKYTNVKSITVKKTKETIRLGKTRTIKAKVNLQDKRKKQLSKAHAAEFRYVSTDKKVATVSKKGKIKAVGKGKCYVYVYAKNGCAKKITVTVK